MATNFPTGVDTFTNPVSNDSLNSPSHSVQHADANDAIEAIENAIIDPANYPNQLVNKTTATVRPLPFATSANRVSFSAPASVPGGVAVTVTFPASRFTQTPVVVLTQTSAVNVVERRFAASSASSTGFTAGYYQDNGSPATTSVDWIAIQMTSASGVG
jgi:hypothetical protein